MAWGGMTCGVARGVWRGVPNERKTNKQEKDKDKKILVTEQYRDGDDDDKEEDDEVVEEEEEPDSALGAAFASPSAFEVDANAPGCGGGSTRFLLQLKDSEIKVSAPTSTSTSTSGSGSVVQY